MAGGPQADVVKKNHEQGRKRSEAGAAKLKSVLGESPMAEAILDLVNGTREDIEGGLNSIRADARGAREAAASVDIKAREIAANAEKVEKANGELAAKAAHLDSQAALATQQAGAASTALSEIQGMLDSLKLSFKEGGKSVEYVGVEALQKLGERVSAIPNTVRAVVEVMLKQTVEVVGEDGSREQKTLTGSDLVSHVVAEVNVAKSSAGAALRAAENAENSAEEAKDLIDTAKGIAEDTQKMVGEANDAASKAEVAARSAEGAVEALTGELKAFQKKMDVAVGAIMAILNKNGLNTELTQEEIAGIEHDSEEGVDNE